MTTSHTQGEHAQTEALRIEAAYEGETLIGYRLTGSGNPESRALVWVDQRTMPGIRAGNEFVPDYGKSIAYLPFPLHAQPAAPQGVAYAELPKDVIRAVFIENGFTVKEGQTDLKQYVYDAANELLRRSRLRASNGQAPATQKTLERNAVPAEWLEQAYREGWAACRDAETIGGESEDWSFGNSTANSRMIDAQQAAPQPAPTAQAAPAAGAVAWTVEPTQEMIDAVLRLVDLETSDPEDHRYDDGSKLATQICCAVLAAAPTPAAQADSVRAPAGGAVAGPTVTREFTNELGNAIRITVEGPNSMHENIVTPMEAEQFRSALNEHAMRAADTTWCAYVAGMICTYLKEDADGDKATAIAGIIERRLMFLSRSTAPMDRDTLYLLRRLLSNQFTFTSAEFRAELEKIVDGATRSQADSVLEDAAQESEYRRGYRHGYEQRDAEVRGALA